MTHTESDVFLIEWEHGLATFEALQRIDWEWLAMDGAMIKPSHGGKHVGQNPTDRSKIGTKRSVLTDGGGVPLGLAVGSANRHDYRMARKLVERLPVARPESTPDHPLGMRLDKGDDEVRELLTEFSFTAHPRMRGKEAKALKQEGRFRTQRCAVEGTNRWTNHSRRLLIGWDNQLQSYLRFQHLGCAYSTYKQSGLLWGRLLDPTSTTACKTSHFLAHRWS